jgi:protein TonB
MLLIIGAHVAAVAVAMSAKFAIEQTQAPTPTYVENIPLPEVPPEPVLPKQDSNVATPKSSPYVPPVSLPRPPIAGPDIGTTTQPNIPSGTAVGTDMPATPVLRPLPPLIEPVRLGPRLATPSTELRPPYPSSKLDSEEEAALRLRLSIDERGRVIEVEPVGSVDAAFFNAARRHLIAKWRYQPATVDGRAIASTTVITLRFELED